MADEEEAKKEVIKVRSIGWHIANVIVKLIACPLLLAIVMLIVSFIAIVMLGIVGIIALYLLPYIIQVLFSEKSLDEELGKIKEDWKKSWLS